MLVQFSSYWYSEEEGWRREKEEKEGKKRRREEGIKKGKRRVFNLLSGTSDGLKTSKKKIHSIDIRNTYRVKNRNIK